MSSSINTAGSALLAFGTSLQITAHNVANLNNDGFNASRATFQERVPAGVSVSASETEDSVDISREATNLVSDSQGFKANVSVIKAAEKMTRELLSIKA